MTEAKQLGPTAIDAVLNEIEEYLTDRSDVIDGSYGRPLPNDEMSLLMELRAAREIAGKVPSIAHRMLASIAAADLPPRPRGLPECEEHPAVRELRNIVLAKRHDREVFVNDTEFADWARSRAAHTLKKLEEGM